jgi:hypothetical protein
VTIRRVNTTRPVSRECADTGHGSSGSISASGSTPSAAASFLIVDGNGSSRPPSIRTTVGRLTPAFLARSCWVSSFRWRTAFRRVSRIKLV